jgi:NADH dehydrogenase/NADH:ubiquinone oxidoreductase subunit G
MRAACSALAVVMLALALGACGESDEEKAQNTVCDAKDDIAKQVDQLASLTPATVTTDAVTQNLDAIKTDLEDISDAQSDLSSDRRNEVEAANKAFASSVQGIASEVGRSLSASDAKAKLVTALQQLEASYQKSFAAELRLAGSAAHAVSVGELRRSASLIQPTTPLLLPCRAAGDLRMPPKSPSQSRTRPK